MQLIEGSFRFVGYTKTIAIFGSKFGYEAKASKATMSLFELGKPKAAQFHIMTYDLAYINLPSVRVISDAAFLKRL